MATGKMLVPGHESEDAFIFFAGSGEDAPPPDDDESPVIGGLGDVERSPFH